MKVEYSEDRRTAFFDGIKFRKDMKTGYYLAGKITYNGNRERLHVYVWRYFNGPVPDGYHVHHKDEDKDNNDIENLTCIRGKTHMKYHLLKYTANHQEEMVENLVKNVRPRAAEWHRSEAGRQWHREHCKHLWDKEPTERICEFCGKPYMTIDRGRNRFCSNNCKSAFRRKSGVDNETRICLCCGEPFQANKYATKWFCSKECRVAFHRDKVNKIGGQTASV